MISEKASTAFVLSGSKEAAPPRHGAGAGPRVIS